MIDEDSDELKRLQKQAKKAEYYREWRHRNPERCAEYRRRYEERHPEYKEKRAQYLRDYQRAWKQHNPDRVRTYARDYAERHPDKLREDHRRWYAKNRDVVSARSRKQKYGLTPAAWTTLFDGQGQACKICRTTSPGMNRKAWATDHNHDTGEVRGILCLACNLALGILRDDLSLVLAAADYLRASIQE